MIKVATNEDFFEINNRRKTYLNIPDLTEIDIEMKIFLKSTTAGKPTLISPI